VWQGEYEPVLQFIQIFLWLIGVLNENTRIRSITKMRADAPILPVAMNHATPEGASCVAILMTTNVGTTLLRRVPKWPCGGKLPYLNSFLFPAMPIADHR
jgi:hypothetical protein